MMFDDASLSAFQSGEDELGVYARLSVDPNVFSETAILKSAYWFTDQYFLFLAKKKESGFWEVEFRLKEGKSLDILKAACGEFSNSLIDQEIRQKVISETKDVRDTLIKKAFFEAKAPLPAKTISTESHLPNSSHSYIDDPVSASR